MYQVRCLSIRRTDLDAWIDSLIIQHCNKRLSGRSGLIERLFEENNSCAFIMHNIIGHLTSCSHPRDHHAKIARDQIWMQSGTAATWN